MTAFWVAEWSRLEKIVGKYVSKAKKRTVPVSASFLSWGQRSSGRASPQSSSGRAHSLHSSPPSQNTQAQTYKCSRWATPTWCTTAHKSLRAIHVVNAKRNTFQLCFCSNSFHKLHLKPLDKTCTIMNSTEHSLSQNRVKLTGSRANVLESVCNRFKTKGSQRLSQSIIYTWMTASLKVCNWAQIKKPGKGLQQCLQIAHILIWINVKLCNVLYCHIVKLR